MQAVETTLDDGTRLRIRPIRPDDKERLVRGFERLSPQSRYRRFFRHIDHLTDRQLAYLTEVDGHDHVAWIATLPDEPGEPGVGVARWVRLRDDPEVAEAAVTVIDAYHNRGIGRRLLLVAAASAIERGVSAFRVSVMADNQPMIQLLKELGATGGRWESGVLELTVPLAGDLDGEHPVPAILRAVAQGRVQGWSRLPDEPGTLLGDPSLGEVTSWAQRP
jgi:GNAT superfamily N-acetyltransferase